MKARFYTLCICALDALLSLAPIGKVSGGEVLYEDNFANLDPSWGTPGEILSVKEGRLVLKPALNTTQSVLNQSNLFDDADTEVQITLSSGDPNVPGGVVFWAKDYSNFYCLSIDANGSFKVSHFVIDRWLNPVGWTESDTINKGVGQTNKLRVVTKGRQATAYINDKEIITINGSSGWRLRWCLRRFGARFAEHVGVRESQGHCHCTSSACQSCTEPASPSSTSRSAPPWI
jgi:hypothetical protein